MSTADLRPGGAQIIVPLTAGRSIVHTFPEGYDMTGTWTAVIVARNDVDDLADPIVAITPDVDGQTVTVPITAEDAQTVGLRVRALVVLQAGVPLVQHRLEVSDRPGEPTDDDIAVLAANEVQVTVTTIGVAVSEEGGGGAPSGPAGGVLGGSYPNPGFAVDMATQAELNTESSTRASGDATNAAAITAEASARATADTNEATARAGADTAEATARAAADSAHVAASDPHGDRAFATAADAAHVAASDPHGDRAYADTLAAAMNAVVFKGVIDCSANPNYPAADAGHLYVVSVAGKIGGGSGPNVQVGDQLLCIVDGTSAGNHATVGVNWTILQVNIDGAVTGPTSAADGRVALFDGTSGKLIKDSGVVLGDAAAKNTGTTAGTVAAGDDARLSDTRTPTDNSVTSAKIADGAIVNADVNAAAAIVLSKLATDPLARANHTGTQTLSTISDAGTAASKNTGTAAGNVPLNSDLRDVVAQNDITADAGTAGQLKIGRTATDVQTFTASGTWTKPANATVVIVEVVGGGGGGGSGRKGAAGTDRYGGGGGQGGMESRRMMLASECGSTETVTVGTGSAGGAAVSASDTDGNAGTAGVASSFGTLVVASGGAGGGAGTALTGYGGNSVIALIVNTLSGATKRGSSRSSGGGDSSTSTTPLTPLGGNAGSGGAGGGISSGNTARAGGASSGSTAAGQVSGGAAGASGTAGTASGGTGPGAGGGGGGAASGGTVGTGGAGGNYGGGGGGGGAGINATTNSGAGGAGADGYVRVTTIF